MTRIVEDPFQALHEVVESLVICYCYESAARRVSLVCDYYRKDPGTDRAFIRFQFDGVASFRKAAGLYLPVQRFVDRYSTRDDHGAVIVQNVEVQRDSRPLRLKLGMGSSFGTLDFSFDGMSAETRSTRAIRRGKDVWDYRDADDDGLLDFHNPFGQGPC